MREHLIKLVSRSSAEVDRDYRHDCEAIRRELNKQGYDATLKDIHDAWSDYSDDFAAGWLALESWMTYEQAAHEVRRRLVEETVGEPLE